MTESTSVEPPVVVEDKGLVVECASCSARTGMPIEIDGRDGEPSDTDWTVTFTTDDGALVVHETYCPEHRIGDAIDDLAEEQRGLTKDIASTYKMVDKMVSS